MTQTSVRDFKTGVEIASENKENPAIFLRMGKSGKGVYFFTPKGNRVFFAPVSRVRQLIEGRIPYAVFNSREVSDKQ